MNEIEKNRIFTEITDEEASIISGGGPIDYLIYMLLAQTPASPGGMNLTEGEIQNGWNILINAAPAINFFINDFSSSISWLSWFW